MNGTVKFFNNIKGWGIITGETGEPFFIHHKNILDEKFFPDKAPIKFKTLKDGQGVSFDVEQNPNAKYHIAKNLRIS